MEIKLAHIKFCLFIKLFRALNDRNYYVNLRKTLATNSKNRNKYTKTT